MPKENEMKLGHQAQTELTEFLIPVLCTGTRCRRVMAKTYAEAAEEAVKKIGSENEYSDNRFGDFRALALPPELMLEPKDRATWPYWAYGWHGTDGIDWRQYRTDKGIGDIPDIAEESWPIPPYED